MSIKNPYLLLIIPFVLAYLAYTGFGFFFKAAVPGSCIVILTLLYLKKLKTSSDIWFVLAAFFFSIAGDWFLSNKGDSFLMFSLGIGFYFLAHVGYLAFAIVNGRISKMFISILLLSYLSFFFLVLFPAISDTLLLSTVLLYLLISCFSVAAAASTDLTFIAKWSYFLGLALILFSDTIIAFHEFTHFQQLNFLILPTYYAAHISVTLALIYREENMSKIVAV